ncbi:MAG: hypothetical protein ACXVI9_00880 [Mucilaginibacter sp.]
MKSYRKHGTQVFFLVLLAIIAGGCNSGRKSKGAKGDLVYITGTQKSDFLSADLDLSGNVKKQELLAGLRLTNTGPKPITITEITVHAEGGLTTFPAAGNIKPVTLPAGRDTLIVTKFNPVNDINVYQLTGRQGHFKQGYKVTVLYKLQGSEKIYPVNLDAQLPPDNYKAYISKYAKPFTGYSFNTATSFGETEADYLETLKLGVPAFAFVAHHEIALTGLNIWMTSYCENDSLYADLLVVNRDNYTLKIIPDALDFTYKDGTSPGQSKSVVLEKKSGSQQNKETLEKDEKVLIHFKKPFKSSDKPVIISLKNAFIIQGAKPFFNNDIDLVKNRLP